MLHYAHSKEGSPPEEWHLLEDHLQDVAKRASDFSIPFGGQDWAHLAGLWHDLGKYSNEFQKMILEANGFECHLEAKPGRPIHSEAGGHWAIQNFHENFARVFCWLIMGHHTGLADYSSADSGAKALEPKMRKPERSSAIWNKVPATIKDQPEPALPKRLQEGADPSFFIRMLFSCLVDADFLDTEAFMDAGRKNLRNGEWSKLDDLLVFFDQHMDNMCRGASPLPVNKIRAEVLAQCRRAAEEKPTTFALTVPTGGGKTLASLAFALRHAKRWNKSRIIYVIPFTSIIEQTAEVFRNIPGFEKAVLEHHCNVSLDDESKETRRSRLASENWDAPIVVTTSVQFFESLHACKTSRCRKLHNIANSVVIFDEAQCLPPDFLRPCIFAIRELQRHYGVTPVLCTATQPVLTKTESFDFKFKEGFDSVTEIISHPTSLFDRLKRVRVAVLNELRPVSYEAIAEAIRSENKSVLCIVNKKDECRTLAQRLPEEQTIHLSTQMCAQHRIETFKAIRKRLNTDIEPLFVISTSLVEAGVDLDFPVVYRALAGLDSIAQAAGRCNREGKLPALGKTVIFVPENQPNYVQTAASLARSYLREDRIEHIFLPTTFKSYFGERFFLLGEKVLDKKDILGLLGNNLEFRFRTAAQKFQLINDDGQLSLIVPVGEAPKLVDALLDWNARSLFRQLQRYTISIPKKIMWQLLDEGHACELTEYPGTYFLTNKGLYDDRFGFIPPDELDAYDPESNII